jgi:hypothetical protein
MPNIETDELRKEANARARRKLAVIPAGQCVPSDRQVWAAVIEGGRGNYGPHVCDPCLSEADALVYGLAVAEEMGGSITRVITAMGRVPDVSRDGASVTYSEFASDGAHHVSDPTDEGVTVDGRKVTWAALKEAAGQREDAILAAEYQDILAAARKLQRRQRYAQTGA